MIFVAWTIKDVRLFRALTLRSEAFNSVIALRLSTYCYAKYFGIPVVGLWDVPIVASLTFWRKPSAVIAIDSKFYADLGITNRYVESAFCEYLRKLGKSLNGSDEVVFLTGTSRLNEQAIQYHFRLNKVIYWEAGINGTIYMSEKGVNANADFRELSHGDKSRYSALFAETCSIEYQSKLIDAPVVEIFCKLVDGLYLVAARYILCNKEVDEILDFDFKMLKNRSKSDDYDKSSDYFLYIDQVEQDTNYTHFGCAAAEVIGYIDFLMADDNVPNNISLLRRAHPRQRLTRVSRQLKNHFSHRYFDDSGSNLAESIAKSKFVITVNSTAGVEALLLGKPVLVLGESYYDQLYGVLSLEDSIQVASGRLTLDADKIKDEVSAFLANNFIPIDFRSGKFFVVEGFDDFLARIDDSEVSLL